MGWVINDQLEIPKGSGRACKKPHRRYVFSCLFRWKLINSCTMQLSFSNTNSFQSAICKRFKVNIFTQIKSKLTCNGLSVICENSSNPLFWKTNVQRGLQWSILFTLLFWNVLNYKVPTNGSAEGLKFANRSPNLMLLKSKFQIH